MGVAALDSASRAAVARPGHLVFLCTPREAVWQKDEFQGRVLSDGLAFNGVGQFKFALVQTSDGTTRSGAMTAQASGALLPPPRSASPSRRGLSVQLGDASA